jgi:hypothetical protein
MSEERAEWHNVELDFAGFGGHSRYTCYTCSGATLLRQPFMSPAQWAQARALYFELHPCTHVMRDGELIELSQPGSTSLSS